VIVYKYIYININQKVIILFDFIADYSFLLFFLIYLFFVKGMISSIALALFSLLISLLDLTLTPSIALIKSSASSC